MLNINKTISSLIVPMVILLPVLLFFSPAVHAEASVIRNFGVNPLATPEPRNGPVKCDSGASDPDACLKDQPIYQWLEFFINLFVIIVVVGSAAMIAYAGIEYMTAGGNAEKTKDARDKIRNVVIGLLTLVFMSAFLQWLIPGGVFG